MPKLAEIINKTIDECKYSNKDDYKIMLEKLSEAEAYANKKDRGFIKSTKASESKKGRGEKITLVKKKDDIRAYRNEELLERLIFIFNRNDCLKNQVNLKTGSPREAIDLVAKATIYELKPWESPNNPLYACIELLKNYYLCDDDLRHTIENLVILAPKEYFEKNKTNFDKFISIKNKLNEELKKKNVKIVLKSIDIEQEEINSIIKKIGKKLADWEKASKDKYEYRKTINLTDYKEDFKPIEQKLLIKNFKDVE